MAKIDLDKLKKELTQEQIIGLLFALGADRYEDCGNYLIFPTICHNEYSDEASLKLYYYKDDFRFHCYTDCGDTFNIYELVKRVFSLQRYNEEVTFSEVLSFILTKTKINSSLYGFDEFKYKSVKEKYHNKKINQELEVFNEGLLNVFTHNYPIEWIKEGISEKTIDKFKIKYSISQNKIIIPHYNMDNRLVGIRGRTLNEDELALGYKYMPVKIEDKLYNHSLKLNLYGLNLTKENIKKNKIAFIFEGEKSVLLYDSLFKENITVASCGSSINKNQVLLLLKLGEIKEIVICFDKEYKNASSVEGQKYFSKLWELGDKYSTYCNFSFIYDRENLLGYKDSPIDKGKGIFLELYKKRIIINK